MIFLSGFSRIFGWWDSARTLRAPPWPGALPRRRRHRRPPWRTRSESQGTGGTGSWWRWSWPVFGSFFGLTVRLRKKKRYHKSNWDILGKTWSKPGTIHQRYLGPFWSGSIIIQQMQRWIPNRWSMRTLGLESQGDASWIHGVGIYKGDYAKSAFCGDVI